MDSSVLCEDGLRRCKWAASSDAFIKYHDEEWGVPQADDIVLFEKLCLEAFQSGLSWRTVLEKRNNLRNAFDGFDFNKVKDYDTRDVERLLADSGIIRHKGKILAVINNAARIVECIDEFGSFAAFVWGFEPVLGEDFVPQSVSLSDVSEALAKALKKRGWKFVGPTTAYAFMQAMGLINDHATGCFRRPVVEELRRNFTRPGG
jgi:DNA-3-methyladenine glycosylase I